MNRDVAPQGGASDQLERSAAGGEIETSEKIIASKESCTHEKSDKIKTREATGNADTRGASEKSEKSETSGE